MPSSVIQASHYDTQARELAITFVSGKVYVYRGVPPVIYAAYERASSKGSFFNAYIRDRYEYQRRSSASAA